MMGLTMKGVRAVSWFGCLVLVVLAGPVFAQSQEELDDVTMRMISEEEELSESMMREIELDAPEEVESDPRAAPEDLGREVRDDIDDVRDSVTDDGVGGSDLDLTDVSERIDEDIINEEGDVEAPIDDVVDDVLDDGGNLKDETGGQLGDTTDELKETTDDVEDTLDP